MPKLIGEYDYGDDDGNHHICVWAFRQVEGRAERFAVQWDDDDMPETPDLSLGEIEANATQNSSKHTDWSLLWGAVLKSGYAGQFAKLRVRVRKYRERVVGEADE